MIVKCVKCQNYTNNFVSICSNHYHCRNCTIINKFKCSKCTKKNVVDAKQTNFPNFPYNSKSNTIQYFDNKKWVNYIPFLSKKIIELVNKSYNNKTFNGKFVINDDLIIYWGKNINRDIYTFSNPSIYKYQNNQIKLLRKYYYNDHIGIIFLKNNKNNNIYLLRIA